jgi:hypothetical protein
VPTPQPSDGSRTIGARIGRPGCDPPSRTGGLETLRPGSTPTRPPLQSFSSRAERRPASRPTRRDSRAANPGEPHHTPPGTTTTSQPPGSRQGVGKKRVPRAPPQCNPPRTSGRLGSYGAPLTDLTHARRRPTSQVPAAAPDPAHSRTAQANIPAFVAALSRKGAERRPARRPKVPGNACGTPRGTRRAPRHTPPDTHRSVSSASLAEAGDDDGGHG